MTLEIAKDPEQASNRYLVALEDHLEKIRGDNDKPQLEDVAAYLGLAGKTAQEKRRRLIDSHFSSSRTTPPSLRILRQIYLGFKIPLAKFGLTEKNLFTPWSPEMTHGQELIPLDHYKRKRGSTEDFINTYLNSIEKHLRKVKKKFYVYDYLGKEALSFFNNELEHYDQANAKVFEVVEELLSLNPEMKYTRVLALPLPENIHSDMYADFQEGIRISSFSKFAHICKCISEFPDQVDFYVIRIPSRVYNYAVIDSTILFSEYFRYNKRGAIIPDLLFIEEVNKKKKGKYDTLLWTYENELNTLTTDHECLISQNKRFLTAVRSEHRRLESEINDLKEKMDKVEEHLPHKYKTMDKRWNQLIAQEKSMVEKVEYMKEFFPMPD